VPERAYITISKSHDEIADAARSEILSDGIRGQRSLYPAAANKQNLRGSDAVAGLGLKPIVQRSMLIVAVSEAAAIGEEIVGRWRPTLEIIERHYSHGRHKCAYECHGGENHNVGFPPLLVRHDVKPSLPSLRRRETRRAFRARGGGRTCGQRRASWPHV
jgi:hypothetical protein